jgi:hypothetical protein
MAAARASSSWAASSPMAAARVSGSWLVGWIGEVGWPGPVRIRRVLGRSSVRGGSQRDTVSTPC